MVIVEVKEDRCFRYLHVPETTYHPVAEAGDLKMRDWGLRCCNKPTTVTGYLTTGSVSRTSYGGKDATDRAML